MADLTEIQASQSVKIAGANPSTGIEDNYLEVDASGLIGDKLHDGSGNAITSNSNGNAGNQLLHVQTPDTTTANATFNALNQTISLSLSGLTGSGFQMMPGNSFLGTVIAEISIDGGTTWFPTNFYDFDDGSVFSSYPITSDDDTNGVLLSIVVLGGTSHARVRVSSYTSGSGTVLMRASHGMGTSISPTGSAGGASAFGTVTNTTPTIAGNTATLILAANVARKYANISNPSGSLAYIAFANTTGLTTSQGIPIPAKTFFEIKGDNLFTGNIYAISSSSITFYITEGTP